ncbi:hypothetical protein SH580_08615 [Coraliomargarita algicola]|uniref:Uncharacterized protein n=1 Tax=Coraliomargarita algicola TaxID=3092156 RepID=A0ABZ0RNT3_9BACT|nr:hypothetical protein [Coraliomargarita sp. J2-16]WPJ97772.1 hypothetical protein SH580_08615 [Coraliomargarita sp. J2-16]
MKEQVNRKVKCFPHSFRFQFTQGELDELVANCDSSSLKSQSATSSGHGGWRYLSSVFAEDIGASLKDLGKKWFALSKFNSGAVEMLLKLERGEDVAAPGRVAGGEFHKKKGKQG